MNTAYPIIMTPHKKHIVVDIPDFNISTEGKNYADALSMARDAIGSVGLEMMDSGNGLPEASDPLEVKRAAGSFISIVDIDMEAYKRAHDKHTVRRNITIPAWLNEEAKSAGLNVSAIATAAIQEALGFVSPA